jgi:hypothetical protein
MQICQAPKGQIQRHIRLMKLSGKWTLSLETSGKSGVQKASNNGRLTPTGQAATMLSRISQVLNRGARFLGVRPCFLL